MTPTASTLRAADRIESTEKSLRVLECFSTERQRLNASMAADRAGLSRAAARRHLLTLHDLGYLEEYEGHYWLSSKVLRLSASYLSSAWLPRVLQPSLNRLAAQTQAVFSAALDDGDAVVIIARSSLASADRATTQAYGLHLGSRAAMHTTSTGRVFLAQKSSTELRLWMATHAGSAKALTRLTPHTLTKPNELRAAVKLAHDLDWAYVAEENELGVHAIAVPLRDMQGQCVAALNVVSSPKALSVDALKAQILPLMQAEAQSLRGVLRM